MKRSGRSKGKNPDAGANKDAETEPLGLPQWEFDKPSEFTYSGEGRAPTPILDAYERSRDPAELERLIKEAYDSLPPRDGPRRNNHKRRQRQKYRAIRRIKFKQKMQKMAAYERKLLKSRERKEREAALFATWRGTADTPAKQKTTVETS